MTQCTALTFYSPSLFCLFLYLQKHAKEKLGSFSAYALAVCAVVTDTDYHLREWYQFYRVAGVAKFYIFAGGLAVMTSKHHSSSAVRLEHGPAC